MKPLSYQNDSRLGVIYQAYRSMFGFSIVLFIYLSGERVQQWEEADL